MFIITIFIFIPITQQPQQDRLAENQPTAGLSSLNEYENEYENGMRKSETELIVCDNILLLLQIDLKPCPFIWNHSYQTQSFKV